MAASTTFGIREVLQCGAALRAVGEGAQSLEERAGAIVREVRARFVDDDTGRPAFALVRCYLTARCGDLEPELQDWARAVGTDAPAGPETVCLTLLATAGEEPAWNDRRTSVGHRAIPLPSVQAVRRLPMVAQLVEQLGLDPRHVVEPDPSLLRDLSERTYNVFYVPDARDSPHVPAQNDFVLPYGIRSVLGFGGVLPSGALFAVVAFSGVAVPPGSVDAFAALALSVKLALLEEAEGRLFAGQVAPRRSSEGVAARRAATLTQRTTTLLQLLDAQLSVTDGESRRLEREVDEAELRAADLVASQRALGAAEARWAAIVEGALDGIIGMDATGRITDFNRAAESAFGYSREEAIGKVLADTIIPPTMRARHRQGLDHLLATGEGAVLGRRLEVNALRRDGEEFPVELTVTQVTDTEPPLFNGYIRDLTGARDAARELATGRERLAHIARTLQTSLLPPVLPDIDGLEVAAVYRALGDGYEVGGDFYDAFELSDGRWAFSLGDVCGKGSEAAVVTALARYTLRAAAMRNRDPAAVLATLNEAIHRQHPDQFCTAVYATADPRTGVVELALGGHPRPFRLSAAGEVTAVGTTSALLGPFEEWHGSTDTVVLAPGDTLVLYSDGVTEARAPAGFFGDDRLGEVLREGAGRTAAAVVHLVEATVLRFAGELDDDLAVLAVRRRTDEG